MSLVYYGTIIPKVYVTWGSAGFLVSIVVLRFRAEFQVQACGFTVCGFPIFYLHLSTADYKLNILT